MEEIWKDVVGYEGLYKVNNLGKVINSDGRIMKENYNSRYIRVTLSKNGSSKKEYVHRIVAKAFVLNHFNYETVNHINENKHNNNVENLEWLTSRENTMKYYHKEKHRFKIGMFTLNNEFIRSFDGVREASRRVNYHQGGISSCLHGHRKQAGGYIWKFI